MLYNNSAIFKRDWLYKNRSVRFEPKKAYSYVLGSPWLGSIKSATLIWTYSSSVFNPLTWRILSVPALHVNRIIVLNLESNNRYVAFIFDIISSNNTIKKLRWILLLVRWFAEKTRPWVRNKPVKCFPIRDAAANRGFPTEDLWASSITVPTPGAEPVPMFCARTIIRIITGILVNAALTNSQKNKTKCGNQTADTLYFSTSIFFIILLFL